MSSLNAFLSQNAKKKENRKVIVSERFVGDDDKPIPFEIKAITNDEDKAFRKSCTKQVQVPGKKNMYRSETDTEAYMLKTAVACTVYPDLNSVELQNSYGVKDGESLLDKMLSPGELAVLLQAVSDINDFDIAMDDKVQEAKN